VIVERLGRLRQASFGVAQHYAIETETEQDTVTRIVWTSGQWPGRC
jgi:hypothetical protein